MTESVHATVNFLIVSFFQYDKKCLHRLSVSANVEIFHVEFIYNGSGRIYEYSYFGVKRNSLSIHLFFIGFLELFFSSFMTYVTSILPSLERHPRMNMFMFSFFSPLFSTRITVRRAHLQNVSRHIV